ncbi:hypothetical protein APE01nite_10900 [Acetobacter peroxydans]|uniref:Uncharacterized protein n=1 Tax=Acetobacter peroxydans TaxID=104098 RepID=A0A4Y3TU55_9PROT|nr:hypothetical protein APE01nite_10900 [Acetobacter peroxydans]
MVSDMGRVVLRLQQVGSGYGHRARGRCWGLCPGQARAGYLDTVEAFLRGGAGQCQCKIIIRRVRTRQNAR